MKISKKNYDLALKLAAFGQVADPDEIAQELQKRDDKIKALRAEVKELRATVRAHYDEHLARSMAGLANKCDEDGKWIKVGE